MMLVTGAEARSRRGARRLENGTSTKDGPISHSDLALSYGIWPAEANLITITQSIAEGGACAKYTACEHAPPGLLRIVSGVSWPPAGIC
jgi:hypothetical protein